ncbi:hypothetical protein CYLTODRAFT_444452 [Cylindrobasidium torrendii FP15055 ss-10]|uniref:MYND-type domain-containing protein n=1 Tax=Cylindrobasidium torrendii FP15055 ss-10 TaxID=1314674 RepID=A0A0D7B891_9AGAR|nr:hypothetical protein CYLTODRAFT_444452 [Cylindrobasidium torrendii FP15055 ss-10]
MQRLPGTTQRMLDAYAVNNREDADRLKRDMHRAMRGDIDAMDELAYMARRGMEMSRNNPAMMHMITGSVEAAIINLRLDDFPLATQVRLFPTPSMKRALEGLIALTASAFICPETKQLISRPDAWHAIWTWTTFFIEACVEKTMSTERAREFKQRIIHHVPVFYCNMAKECPALVRTLENRPEFCATWTRLWYSERSTDLGNRHLSQVVSNLLSIGVVHGFETGNKFALQFVNALGGDHDVVDGIVATRLMHACHQRDYEDVRWSLSNITAFMRQEPTRSKYMTLAWAERIAGAMRSTILLFDKTKEDAKLDDIRGLAVIFIVTLFQFMSLGPVHAERILHADLLDTCFTFVATIGLHDSGTHPERVASANATIRPVFNLAKRFAVYYEVLKQLHHFVRVWEPRMAGEIPRDNKEMWEIWEDLRELTNERWKLASQYRRRPEMLCSEPTNCPLYSLFNDTSVPRAINVRHKMCSGCNIMYYCSERCQSFDWANHKIRCKGEQAYQKDIEKQLILPSTGSLRNRMYMRFIGMQDAGRMLLPGGALYGQKEAYLARHPNANPRLLTVEVDYCQYPPKGRITHAEDPDLKSSVMRMNRPDGWTKPVEEALRRSTVQLVLCIMPITEQRATKEFLY